MYIFVIIPTSSIVSHPTKQIKRENKYRQLVKFLVRFRRMTNRYQVSHLLVRTHIVVCTSINQSCFHRIKFVEWEKCNGCTEKCQHTLYGTSAHGGQYTVVCVSCAYANVLMFAFVFIVVLFILLKKILNHYETVISFDLENMRIERNFSKIDCKWFMLNYSYQKHEWICRPKFTNRFLFINNNNKKKMVPVS